MLPPIRGGSMAWLLQATARAVVFPRVRAVVYYRLSQALARRGLVVLAYCVQSRAIARTGAEINPHAQIGPGLNLLHSVGVVIGSQVRIGAHAWIYQGVTIGCGVIPGQPTIGDDVFIGAGAKVLGGVRIGNNVTIGANAVVVRDLPDGCTARGVPAVPSPRKALS